MKQVSICIITCNNFLRTKYFVQNLLFKTSHKYKLHILDNNSSSTELKKYINEVTIDTGGVFINSQQDLSISECYNKLLNTVENKFCVFVPITALVTKNWLIGLVTSFKEVPNSGIVGIRSGLMSNVIFTPQLHETNNASKLLNVMTECTEWISGIAFFETEHVKKHDFIEEDMVEGYEIEYMCYKLKLEGKISYYVRNQFAFNQKIESEKILPNKSLEKQKLLYEKLDKMIKNNYKQK